MYDGQFIHVEVINGRPGESEKFAKLIISRVNSGPLNDRKLALADRLAKATMDEARKHLLEPDAFTVTLELQHWNKLIKLARKYQAIKEEE